MKIRFFLLLLLLPSANVLAQGLPLIPKAQEINVGTLQNGADFFFVKNIRETGYADFALVRQSSKDGQELRDALKQLPHFTGSNPYEFLTGIGVGYGPGGFVSSDGQFETMRFPHVPVHDQQVCDSTLLLIFDVMSLSDVPQAVIVSGDIDVATIRERSNLLSLMASFLPPHNEVASDAWIQRDTLRYVSLRNQTRNSVVIKLIYSSRRTSPADMKTVLPLVTGMYAEELGYVIDARLRASFREEKIPLTGLKFSYKDSSSDLEDERFSFSLVVPADKIDASMRLAGSILGDLDRNGVSRHELLAARNRMSALWLEKPAGSLNSEYVDKCLDSYRYGSDLASDEYVRRMYVRRGMQTENELQLFNNFASALLDPEKNLVLRVDAPDPEEIEISALASFRLGWTLDNRAGNMPARVQTRTSSSKVRLMSEAAEPISGGTIWTFSNGIKVIFKRQDTPGEMSFAFFGNGGYPMVPGTDAGEAVFAGDLFPYCRFGGMDCQSFMDILAVKGISINASVSMSSFQLSGTAPSVQLRDVIDAMLTMSSDIEISKEDFEYYVLSEALSEDSRALYPREVRAISDSILCPGYWYLERKSISRLGINFNERAAEYFQKQFSKCNDGVFVFSGDLDPELLKKELLRLLGEFKTLKGVAKRPRVNYPMISGKAMWVRDASEGLVGGKELGVNVCLSARQPYDNKEIMTFRVTAQIVRKEMAKAMAECGYYIDFASREDNYPKSTFTIYANCYPCRQDGLPSGIGVKDQFSALSAMRNALEKLPEVPVSAEDMKAFKAFVKSDLSVEVSDSKAMFDKIEARYCEGKDMVSGTESALDSVTADDVHDMLLTLLSGAGVEYVIL